MSLKMMRSLLWSGKLFQAVGPATQKEQSPNFAEDHGICSKVFNEDRIQLSATLMQKSVMSSGTEKGQSGRR